MKYDFTIIREAGLSQREFAELAGVSRVTVSNYTSGKCGVGPHVAPKVSRALKIVAAALRIGTLPSSMPPATRHSIQARKDAIAAVVEDILARSRNNKAAQHNQ